MGQRRHKTQSSLDNRRARRGIDPLTLIVGLGALFAAAVGLSKDTSWVSAIDPRWLLAAGAVLVGVLLLVGTLRIPNNARSRHRSSGHNSGSDDYGGDGGGDG
jgi:hypothetical protein